MQLTEDVKDYWNLRSEGFSSSIREEEEFKGVALADKLISDAGLRPGSKVLDIGCGPGLFTMVLSGRGMDVTGIDYSDEMLNRARANAHERGIDAEFMKMDACDLTFEDRSFDAIVSRNVLWNLERPADAYSEMLRVLRPGGRLAVYDGNFYLHLFDEDFSRARESRREAWKDRDVKGSHDKYRGDVDFNIIEELAKDLPLSRELRPAWDVKVLQQLPCSDIALRLHRGRGGSDEDGRLVVGFEIIVTKENYHVQ